MLQPLPPGTIPYAGVAARHGSMRDKVRDARTARSGSSEIEPLPEDHRFLTRSSASCRFVPLKVACASAEAAAFSCGQSQARWPSLSPQLPTYPHGFVYREVIYPAGTSGLWRGWDG
jgi:hypothetical protein